MVKMLLKLYTLKRNSIKSYKNLLKMFLTKIKTKTCVRKKNVYKYC